MARRFDIYVGSLARLYARNWETSAQHAAREHGHQYFQICPGGEPPAIPTAEARASVDAWRQRCAAQLGAALKFPLAWDESVETPYFSERTSFYEYSALLLLAAFAERPEFKDERPVGEVPEDWTDEPAWIAATAHETRTESVQLHLPHLWLPVDFGFVFEFENVLGGRVTVGSSPVLHRVLTALDASERRRLAAGQPPNQAGSVFTSNVFDKVAHEALARFLRLAAKSVEHGLPILLAW